MVATGIATLAAAAFLLPGGLDASAQDLAAARQQFVTSCGVCHSAEKGEPHRQGPNLSGIYGRPAGAVETFKYSEKLKSSGWLWDEPTLARWVENAQAALPGTIMVYRQADPAKRALLLAYLKTLKQE